jgi:hypothetical protein
MSIVGREPLRRAALAFVAGLLLIIPSVIIGGSRLAPASGATVSSSNHPTNTCSCVASTP